ncbi:MAG: glycine cleavage system protein GcvH [Candidatus Sericytochromatia bacterium]
MSYDTNFKYAESHECLLLEDNIATVSITPYAVEQLGDIVYVELPKVGTEYKKGATFGVVESVKSVSDLYSPMSGKVIEINNNLVDSPELLASESLDEKWIMKLEVSNLDEINKLMNSEDYSKMVEEA